GFAGEQVPDPWGDRDGDRHGDHWRVPDGLTYEELVARLRAGGERTAEIVGSADLGDTAAIGGPFATPAETPTLVWILFHVLQEYARHAGHLDVVRELADGTVGE
ncbi:MAG: DUF664 domain-containing protein, partial [Nocardioidaceae bacterium]